jgi:hypothetical protein
MRSQRSRTGAGIEDQEGGQGTPYNTLSECLEARAKATQTAICINR